MSSSTIPKQLVEPQNNNANYIDLHSQLPQASIHQGLLLPSSSAHPEQSLPIPITKDYINKELYGERAIVLHNVLTPQECLQLSSLTDEIKMQDASADHRYRNNMRCEIKSQALAKVLLQRIMPFVEHQKVVTPQNVNNFMQRELMIGDWNLCGMNDQFVVCYYLSENKGHLGPHYDGEHNPSQDVCSMKTFMIYLNDEYEGGTTNFLKEDNGDELKFDEEKGIYCASENQILAKLKAKQGDCLIFDHKILHEGSQVTSGKKFIFRSELMYKRTSGVTLTEEQKQGRAFLAQARYCEDQKDFDTAVKYYQKAFKICPELERLV